MKRSTSAPHTAAACAVFCASRTPASAPMRRSVRSFGALLGARGVDMLYGAVASGVMDLVATSARDAGARVIGFTTRTFHRRGLTPGGLSELHIAHSLAGRKAAILKRASFAAVLPGGIGTLDELFEVLALVETGALRIPVGVLNAERFYTPVLRQLREGERAGLVNPATTRRLIVETRPAILIDRLLAEVGSSRTGSASVTAR